MATTKSKKGKAAQADKGTAKVIAKKITDKKELLYDYPADCDTLKARKRFRSATRSKIRQLTKAITAAVPGQVRAAKNALRSFEAEALLS